MSKNKWLQNHEFGFLFTDREQPLQFARLVYFGVADSIKGNGSWGINKAGALKLWIGKDCGINFA